MSRPLFIVDAFTDVAFRGNPAAVVLLDESDPRVDDSVWMQAVAAEMNLSETAFCAPCTEGGQRLRWFTPAVEVDLCGHATLATAHVLQTTGGTDDVELVFHTRSGALRASACGDGRIELDLPAKTFVEASPRDGLFAALGIDSAEYVAMSDDGYQLVVLADSDVVRAVRPDFDALGRLGEHYGVIVTAPASEPGHDFVSRYFVPSAGIDEDPVTGAAHCGLGPYWSARLGLPIVRGLQVSARTGRVECEPRGDRVLLRGHAITIVTGSLET
jgi:PhzF family phenazine biosynthesis protein